jgi:tetratricopeptide (TPR) repeat protein
LRWRESFETFSALWQKAVETTPQQEAEFDPLAFWIEHKGKIRLLLALLVFGLLAYGIFQFAEKRARENSANDFARAKTPEDFRKVIAAHPRSVVAGNAHLILADLLRNEGKHDEAITNLRSMIDRHPDHPLISGAWTSLAFCLEAQGKSEEALSTLQKVAATYPTSFAAPVALMAEARIFTERNDVAQAKRIYEQVVSQFGQSDFARQALVALQRLKKGRRRSTLGSSFSGRRPGAGADQHAGGASTRRGRGRKTACANGRKRRRQSSRRRRMLHRRKHRRRRTRLRQCLQSSLVSASGAAGGCSPIIDKWR